MDDIIEEVANGRESEEVDLTDVIEDVVVMEEDDEEDEDDEVIINEVEDVVDGRGVSICC